MSNNNNNKRRRASSIISNEDVPVIFGPSSSQQPSVQINIGNIPRNNSSDTTSSSDNSDKNYISTFPWHHYRESKANVERKTPMELVEYLNNKIEIINYHDKYDGSDLYLEHDDNYHNPILKDADDNDIKKNRVAIISFIHKELDFLHHNIDKKLSLSKRDKPHIYNENSGGFKKKTHKRKTNKRKTQKKKTQKKKNNKKRKTHKR